MAQWSIGITALLCTAVIISDLYARRVSNKALLIALCLGAVVLLCESWDGNSTATAAVCGLLLGLLALLPFHLLGWMGAGDVKFFAVIGFLLGPASLLPIWLISMLLLSAHGAANWVWRGTGTWRCMLLASVGADGAGRIQQCNQHWLSRLQHARGKRQGMPYAAHLGISALLWMAWRASQ